MSAAAFAAVGLGFSSCSMDMLPLNEIVLENYWTEKKDVESVVRSCYNAMTDKAYIQSLLVWGEDRSDNVKQGDKSGYPSDLRYLLQGSIKTTNSYLSWAPIYTAINRCNTVLHYAPIVAEKDPNYTESDLRVNIAECKFIRAFSYFHLVKSFKDVPFSFEPSIDDTQAYMLPQSKHEDIIDSLILDLEGCKDYAPRRYAKLSHNTGKVTRIAMYSLLADLYLWRASDFNLDRSKQNEYYRKCIECCDYVISQKINAYETNEWQDYDLRQYIDKEVYTEYGYPLVAEELTQGTNNNGPFATNWIFAQFLADKNRNVPCFENIFEIMIRDTDSGVTLSNEAVREHFGTEANSQLVIANEKMLEKAPQASDTYTDNKLFSVPSDYRSVAWFYFNETTGGYNIYKYVVGNNKAGSQGATDSYGAVGSKYTASKKTQEFSGTPNWIIYRLSEIMLFRAEAEIELAKNIAGELAEQEPADDDTEEEGETTEAKHRKASVADMGSDLSTPEELYDDAFKIISAVYRRSNPYVKKDSKYAPTKPTEYSAFSTLLMNERRREFLFEGKRYYDLVRQSRRAGDTRLFRSALSSKYGEAGAAVAMKMVRMDFMYLPVSRAEMKVNLNLVQNSCYLDEIENIKN